MNSSLKIGAVSGLVAGFVLGTVYEIFANTAVLMSLFEPWFRPVVTGNIVVNIPLFGFWGVVLGIIFSKTHYLIPGKDSLKGLIYGLILFVIVTVRLDTYWVAYGYYLWLAGDVLSWPLAWVAYGLVLGFLYESLYSRYYPAKEKPKIITYDMKNGILPGAIAGTCGGTAASVVAILGPGIGLWKLVGGPAKLTFSFWMGQAGTHIVLNMIWGTVFGFIFPKVYNLVPSSGVKKGLCYGLTVFLITTFQICSWLMFWYVFHKAWLLVPSTGGTMFIGAAQAIVFGLVLGALYKKQ